MTFSIVRSGVSGDVIVHWRLGLEAVNDFYPPLDGSVVFHNVIHSFTNAQVLSRLLYLIHSASSSNVILQLKVWQQV